MIFEKLIVGAYKGMMHKRCDDCETVFYFSAADFPGLKSEEYTFKSSMGHSLKGYLYSYENPTDNRLVVFDHGFGGGHRAYMKEIERLCAHGFLVLAYDHTGCMESGGESPNGLAQSLCDLNDCIATVKADGRFANREISVMGHSWGGFSTLNISYLHPEITHVVVMAGFVSVKKMIESMFSGLLFGYRNAVMRIEEESNPIFSKMDAIASLKVSNAKALLIYSDDDMLCRRTHYDALSSALSDRENVTLLLVNEKGHNPNYTKNAIKLLSEFSKARAKLLRKKRVTPEEKARFVSSFDWGKMTEQDEGVWNKIFEHLDS